jgi:hypothetical protein
MELKKKVLQFKFEDENVELKFPTVVNMRDYGLEVENAKKEKAEHKIIDIMLDLLVKLGLPTKFRDELENDHVEMIMTSLMPKGDKGK